MRKHPGRSIGPAQRGPIRTAEPLDCRTRLSSKKHCTMTCRHTASSPSATAPWPDCPTRRRSCDSAVCCSITTSRPTCLASRRYPAGHGPDASHGRGSGDADPRLATRKTPTATAVPRTRRPNVNDSTSGQRRHGEEHAALGEAGYQGVHKRLGAASSTWHVAMRPSDARSHRASLTRSLPRRLRPGVAGSGGRGGLVIGRELSGLA